jgi:hypothetical protein
MRRSRWAILVLLAVSAGELAISRVLSAHPVALLVLVPALIIAAVVAGVRQFRRGGEPLRDVLQGRRQRARARVDSADKLRVEAPLGAGWAALASFPAVLLAFAVTGSFGASGVYLPPAADARWQLGCVAIAVAGAVVAVDYWFGLGTSVRALATDAGAAAIAVVTIALAVTSPLMILWPVESRPAWLAVLAAQFCWPFAGLILGAAVSGRRKRRRSPPAHRRSPATWLAEFGIEANRDLILVSPGSRKALVINAVITLTGMRPREAQDLIDNAPGLVMRQVTSERADRAKEVLETLGATVTITSDPHQF